MGTGNWLSALDFYLSAPKEIALIGGKNDPAMEELAHIVSINFLPDAVIAAYDDNDPARASGLKLFEGKTPVNGHPAVYICRSYTCQAPVTDPATLRRELRMEKTAR